MNYAGFGIRLLAYLIDFTLFTSVSYLIWGQEVVDTSSGLSISFNNEELLLPLAYLFFFWMFTSSSPGKMVAGLKIVTEKGEKVGAKEAGLRILGYLLLFIGCWFILGDREKRQALHDRIAKTVVIKS